jgi:hypothetical protein
VRLAVLDSHAPFADRLLAGRRLCEALREHGHETVHVALPFSAETAERIVDQMLAMRLLHLERAERAIGLRFPAYLVPHEHTVLWALRTGERALGAAGALVGGGSIGRSVRRSVFAAERTRLRAARTVYAPSASVATSLQWRLRCSAEVLHLPPADPGRFHCESYADRVLALGPAWAAPQREQVLAAVAQAHRAVRVTMAAPQAALADLRVLADRLGVADRVQLVPQPAGEAERAALLAPARALFTLDPDPDSAFTIEAFHARKGVLVLGEADDVSLVRDGVSGRVAPSLEGAGAALDELAEDSAAAERYGAGGYSALHDGHVSWPSVVAELTR